MNTQLLKKAFYTLFISLLATTWLTAQQEPAFSVNTDGSISIGPDITVQSGDTLIINIPMSEDFAFVQAEKKGGLGKLTKIGGIGGSIGSAVGSVGALSGSIGALKTGIDIMHAGNAVYSAGSAAEQIADLNLSKKAKKLVGKRLVINAIQNPQDVAMGMVTVTGKIPDDKKTYTVSLLQAFYTGEILINGKHVSSLYTQQQQEN